jgi:hypothetical protein
VNVKGEPYGELPATLPRIGVVFPLDPAYERVAWFGRGPRENYPDSVACAPVGRYECAVSEMNTDYDYPQETGNREGTYSVKLATGCDDVTFTATGDAFAFEVNPYAPETLVKFAHPAELPKSDSTFFGIYAKVRGLGGNSCGPRPLPRDIVGRGPYTLEFVIK